MGVLGQAPYSLGSLPPGLHAQLAASQAQMAASQAMAQVHVQQQQPGGPSFQRDSGQPQGVKVCAQSPLRRLPTGAALMPVMPFCGIQMFQDGHQFSLWRWLHLLLHLACRPVRARSSGSCGVCCTPICP